MKLCPLPETEASALELIQRSAVSFLLTILPSIIMLCCLTFMYSDAVSADLAAIRKKLPNLTFWMELVSIYGNYIFYAVYLFLALWNLKKGNYSGLRLLLCYALCQAVIVALIGQFIKIAVGRPRPFNDGPYVPFTLQNKNHSFISGHIAEITGAVLPLSLIYRKMLFSFVMGCVIAIMGFSRLFLGKHHLQDIWLGLILGSVSGICAVFLWRRWSKKNEQRA